VQSGQPSKTAGSSSDLDFVNTAEISGEAGDLDVGEYRILLPVKSRATGEEYRVIWSPHYEKAIDLRAPKGALLSIKGWLIEDREYDGEVLIRGWNPERHLLKATREQLAQPPTARLIGTVTQVFPRNLVELSVVNNYGDKEYENKITLGLSRQVRRSFRSKVRMGVKVKAKIVLAGEKHYPWDGTPRITHFGILKESK